MYHPSPSFQYSLDYFRLGLHSQLLSKTALTAWADAQLLNNHYPSHQEELVELSLCQNQSEKEMTALITTFIGTAYSLTGSRLFLHLLHQQQDWQQHPQQLEAVLYLLELPPEEQEALEELHWTFDVDKHFYPMLPAEREKNQQKALQFLACYQDYQLDKLEQLPILEAQLQIRLQTYFQHS